MSKRRVGVENAGYGRLSGRNDDLIEVLRYIRVRHDEACGRLRKQEEPHISRFLYKAASLFFVTDYLIVVPMKGKLIIPSDSKTYATTLRILLHPR